MKNEILIPDPPTCDQQACGGGREGAREREKINKRKKIENAFALVVTPLRSLVSREFTIAE